MKIFKYIALSVLAVGALSSCNDYLDTLPDDRAEIETADQVRDLLVSAYPDYNNNTIMEMMSDNVTDNGKTYASSVLKDELYRFKDVDDTGNDSPYQSWNGYYRSVASANEALQSIERLGLTESAKTLVAEAKMIRAYSMFQLANTFCMAWNPAKADEYLGLPYPTEPAKFIGGAYKRGTLRELYENINKDIEEALPNIDDNTYSVPKYHFNKKAAYAFAARFNLYYMNYDKCIAYANEVLGSDPTAVMRQYEPLTQFGAKDIGTQWIKTSDAANLMILATISGASYNMVYPVYPRFQHNTYVCSFATYWAKAPWGSGSGGSKEGAQALLYYSNMLYGSSQGVFFPKMMPQFEITDKINQTGYLHCVDPIFTGDETLLCRAEAYALSSQPRYDLAINDINTWIKTHCREKATDGTARPVLDEASLNSFMDEMEYSPAVIESWAELTIRKKLHPQGFTVAQGTQENIINLILHMRRLETMYQGLRFIDLKRYGISYTHLLKGEEQIIFNPESSDYADPRGAIQLPADVIKAGLPANPR